MDKEKQFTNRLINETSPYLLQHAHNPVDWFPWCDEAFAKAKAEDKPVLVSIGYSACHWCHVMEHESFEDEAVAAIMNEDFINVKVDMEERPDVDQIYMNFVQLTTGRGGWPMNVFLTPDKKPFFGGTYFPPTPRYNMPSWPQILQSIAEAYREKRDELEDSAAKIVTELSRMSNTNTTPSGLSAEIVDGAFSILCKSFDRVNGGFGGAPKFPPSMTLEFLLRYHHRTGDKTALAMVEHTLRKMASGGIYDQIGGGFHRYAVDAIWLVPHFEKMLYDNAQLIKAYLHTYQVTKDEFYKRIAVETLDYVRREMLDPSGGFYSAQDADSDGVEGKFFVWTPADVERVLGKSEAAVFCRYYDVTAGGNFEGENILNIRSPRGDGDTEVFDTARQKLFAEREQRIKPHRDEKVLTAWNGLMLSAFSEAAAILSDDGYLAIAERNAEFILDSLQDNGVLLRTWKDGAAKLDGYLEDHANVADGLLDLFQASGSVRYLSEAKRLAELMITEFWDNENGGFFFTSNDHEEMIVRNKDFYDNAMPSGNSVAAGLLLRLSKFLGDGKFERFAVAVLRLSANQATRHPQGFGRALSSVEFYLSDIKEIVMMGPRGNDLDKQISGSYLPDAVIIRSEGPVSHSELVPLLEGKIMVDDLPTVYICENSVCERPITSPADLGKLNGK